MLAINFREISFSCLYKFNCLIAACAPIFALILATCFNGANPYFMSISAYYILMPSRLVFTSFILFAVAVHIWLLSNLKLELDMSKKILLLETFVFASVAAIALAPAHAYRIHGLLGGLCFSSATMFMSAHYWARLDKYIIDFLTLIVAVICFLAMPIYFPWVLNWEIMGMITHHGNIEKIVSMMNNHDAWKPFALFEWTFYYVFLFYCYRLYNRFV